MEKFCLYIDDKTSEVENETPLDPVAKPAVEELVSAPASKKDENSTPAKSEANQTSCPVQQACESASNSEQQLIEPPPRVSYSPVAKPLTFMQKKLLLLQQENLAAFHNHQLGEGPKKLSKLQQEQAALKELQVSEPKPSKQEQQPAANDIWGNVVKKRSRLEMEKEAALAAKSEAVQEPVYKRKKLDEVNDYWKD